MNQLKTIPPSAADRAIDSDASSVSSDILDRGKSDYASSKHRPAENQNEAVVTHLSGASANITDQPSEEIRLATIWETFRDFLQDWCKALRLHQHAKNTLIFVPLLTSHSASLASLYDSLVAFLTFSLCASSGYLFNDVVDLAADRSHPTKCARPIASGRISVRSSFIAIPTLAVTSLLVSLLVSWQFACMAMGYLGLTLAYSLYLKRRMLIDIVTLAGLYTTRIIGGAVAIGVSVSEWLLTFSLFVFTALALVKRYSELVMRADRGLTNPTNRDYKISDSSIVAALAAASGMNAITVFSLYISSPVVASAYSRPLLLWALNPLLLYWIGRALLVAHRREMHEDPIIYTFTDSSSRITVLLMVCFVLAAI